MNTNIRSILLLVLIVASFSFGSHAHDVVSFEYVQKNYQDLQQRNELAVVTGTKW